MGIDEKIKIVEEKLDTGNYNLTKEDIYLIENESHLKEKIYNLMKTDRNIYNYPIVEEVRNNMVEIDVDLLYNICIYEIDRGEVTVLSDLIERLGHDNEKVIFLKDYLFKKISMEDYKVERIFCDNDLFNELIDVFLENDRYNDINKTYLVFPSLYNEKNLEKIIDTFSFDIAYGLPIGFSFRLDFELKEYILKNGYDRLPLELVGDTLFDNTKEFYFDRMKTRPKEFYYLYNIDDLRNTLMKCSAKELQEFLTLCLKNDYFEPFFFESFNKKWKEGTIKRISDAIVRRGGNFCDNLMKLNDLINNEEILLAFIKTCNFKVVRKSFEFKNCSKEKKEFYIEKMVDAINESSELDCETIYFNGIEKYPKIIKALILKDRSLSLISNISLSKVYSSNKEIRDLVDDILLNSDNVNLDSFLLDRNILLTLLKNKKYEMISKLSSKSINYNADSELLDLLYEGCLDGNLYFINKVVRETRVANDERFLDLFLFNKYIASKVVSYIINSGNEKYYTEEVFNFYKKHIAEYNVIDLERFEKIEKVVGPSIIKYLNDNCDDENNVMDLIDFCDDRLFDKILALFPDKKFDYNDALSIYDSLKQYEFSKKYSNVVNIFSLFNQAIEFNNYQQIEDLKVELSSVLDEKFFTLFKDKYSDVYKVIGDMPDFLLNYVVYRMKSYDYSTQNKYRGILHFITDYYVSVKREEYRENCDMGDELGLPYTYLPKDVKNTFAKEILKNNISVRNYLVNKLSDNMDVSLIKDSIEYYLNNDSYKFQNNIKDIQSNMYLLIKELKTMINENFTYEEQEAYVRNNVLDDSIKKQYYIDDVNNSVEIIEKLDLSSILDDLILNKEIYDSLVEVMDKYKLHRLPRCFDKLLNSEYLNFGWKNTNLSDFINYYTKIYKQEKNNSNCLENEGFIPSVCSVFINSSKELDEFSFYKKVLGEDDYLLVKSNPRPNSSSLGFVNRIESAINYTKNCYERKEITVPSFNKVIDVNGKDIRVIVGNFTKASNITHGERTGSCMRIGGVGESLFDFCLKNKNGFHIEFLDSKTGEYISRVSGFRNGNTVFLNQLRDSCSSNYRNLDLIEGIKLVSKELIESSINDKCPIDNVVASPDFVLENYGEVEDLNVEYIKEGLPYFYTDVTSAAIVLASSRDDNRLVPINFDKSNLPSYPTARLLIKEGEYLEEDINRVHCIRKLLEDDDCKNVSPLTFDKKIKYTICNNDWYICIDEDNKIYCELISIDPRAELEFRECYNEIIRKMDNDKSIKKKILDIK